jgi:predicted DNA-binding protein with PD1-like motif
MQVMVDGDVVVIRLHEGEDLFSTLLEALRQADLRYGVVLTGVGMLKDFELGWFDHATKGYVKRGFPTPHELVAMSGTVAVAVAEGDEPTVMPHVHVALAGPDLSLVGGHLWKATVTVLNEISVRRIEGPMHRRLNPATGLMELDLG